MDTLAYSGRLAMTLTLSTKAICARNILLNMGTGGKEKNLLIMNYSQVQKDKLQNEVHLQKLSQKYQKL